MLFYKPNKSITDYIGLTRSWFYFTLFVASSLECYVCNNCQPNFVDSVTGNDVEVCPSVPLIEAFCVKEFDTDGGTLLTEGQFLSKGGGEGANPINKNYLRYCVND